MKSCFFLFFLTLPLNLKALSQKQEILTEATALVSTLNLKPLPNLDKTNWNLYRLGEKLFFETALSGNRNISCSSCHRLDSYSADGLALGIGQGARFEPGNLSLKEGGTLQRHTPHLINTGYPDVKSLFWDSRIGGRKGNWKSPLIELNGENPERKDLAEGFNNILALQSVFPLITDIEMLGYPGQNELADQKNPFLSWEKIVARILDPFLQKKYTKSLKKAFPDLKEIHDIKIYHVGNALSEYMRVFFSSNKSPYDLFLAGDKEAMDLQSLRGMKVFFGKGKCSICHNGPHLTNFQPLSSGAPQIVRSDGFIDRGLYEVTKRGRHQFLFKTPALRNIALTAPYMHSGALETLEEVVEHYNNIGLSLNTFQINPKWYEFYNNSIFLDQDKERNELRRLQVRFGPFLSGLHLTLEEKGDLVHFLKVALTDQDFKKRLDDYQQQ